MPFGRYCNQLVHDPDLALQLKLPGPALSNAVAQMLCLLPVKEVDMNCASLEPLFVSF